MIYFISNTETHLIKIGFSKAPKARKSGLQCAAGATLKFLGVMDGGLADEAALHARFAADRVRGEWFRPSNELAQFIAEHARSIDTVKRGRRDRDPYREAFASALKKRIGHLPPAQADYFRSTVGIDTHTLRRWLGAEGAPSFEAVCKMAEYFRKEGDCAFIGEIFGYHPPNAKVLHDLMQALADLVAWHQGYPNAEYQRWIERSPEIQAAKKSEPKEGKNDEKRVSGVQLH